MSVCGYGVLWSHAAFSLLETLLSWVSSAQSLRLNWFLPLPTFGLGFSRRFTRAQLFVGSSRQNTLTKEYLLENLTPSKDAEDKLAIHARTERQTDIYIYIFFIIQRAKAHAIPCPHHPLTRGDNTVSEAQGGTATPGATKQLLPPDRVFKRNIYIYIYVYMRAGSTKAKITLDVRSSSFFVQFVLIFKNALTFSRWCYSNRFLMLRNHTGMVVPRGFHSCWNPFCIRRLFDSFSFSFIFFYALLHQGTPNKRRI